MADTQHEIASAILAAAVVAKSELTGHELATYAMNIYRNYVKMMIAQHQKETETE